jgi:S-formylglutathione hydrolase
METYLVDELPTLIAAQFPVDPDRQGIMGHSMGGHGALTLALRHAGRYRSVSALAPIVAPSQTPWGRKALRGYLGESPAGWRAHDAVALIEDGARVDEILVDQGDADEFMDEQLRPELLHEACANAGIPLTLNLRSGYDHAYCFVSTFMADQLRWHAARLR